MSVSARIAAIAAVVVLITAGLVYLITSGQTVTGDGDILLVRGVGNSGNNFYGYPSARRLERVLRADRDLPLVSDDDVRAMVAAVAGRAARGEVDAVHFMVELAAVQRARARAEATPAK
jgi:hypothetical protein